MKYTTGMFLVTAIAVVLIGCTPSPLNDSYWVPRRPLGDTYDVYRPPIYLDKSKIAEDRHVAEPKGGLMLREALAMALLGNPELAKSAFSVRIAEAHSLQAGLGPNPEIEVEFENFAGSGAASGTDSMETTVALSQAIPLGGDIEYRQRVAQLHGELAGWDYEAQADRFAGRSDAALYRGACGTTAGTVGG